MAAGRVVGYGRCDEPIPEAAPDMAAVDFQDVDLGTRVVLPGLVNAHLHLELSWMRGRLTGARTFPDWIGRLLELRRTVSPPESVRAEAIEQAHAECYLSGTALVGDVANSWETVAPLSRSRLCAVIFRELIGFQGEQAQGLAAAVKRELADQDPGANVRISVAAHAPYSVSPQLFRAVHALRDELSTGPARLPSSLHLGESRDEVDFLRTGDGRPRRLLETLGRWDETWTVPACDPVEYVDRLGVLDQDVLCVHGVHLDPAALDRLRQHGATLVCCPRGNRLTGAGSPPVADFYRAGLKVALGTDSLASVPDLNLFAEMSEIRRLAPDVPARWILECATRQGARALGWDADFGTMEPGRRAALLAVDVPSGTGDASSPDAVEEYLVSGVAPGELRWVTESGEDS